VGTAGGLTRKQRVDPTTAQFSEAFPAHFPLLPNHAPLAATYPAIKVDKHRKRLAETKISMPSSQVNVEIFNHPLQANAPCASRNFPNSLLEAHHRLRRYPPFLWFLRGKTEAQEFTLPWPRATALFSLLTFSLSLVVMKPVMLSITRSPAR